MSEDRKTVKPINASFDDVTKVTGQVKGAEGITPKANKISVLAAKSKGKEITSRQEVLPLSIEKSRNFDEIGMGILSDGTPYLNQRGLAALCGVENAHIGTISSQWNEPDLKPRIQKIKGILASARMTAAAAHVEIVHNGQIHYCYPTEICLAVLEYYAFDAGVNVHEQARQNFRLLAGSNLQDMIYQKVGYDPTSADRFEVWHKRLALNYQSAPKGYFHVFNEANTIIYEMIIAGAKIDSKFVVDISIGKYWSTYWDTNNLGKEFGRRAKYPHKYPDDHPQSKSNPQESWCYPLAALGRYRAWLQSEYIDGGMFSKYLVGKVKQGELPPSSAELAISRLAPSQMEGTKG